MNARLEAARRWVQSTVARAATSTLTRTRLWWGAGASRQRLRRRLVVASVPATVVLLVVVAKLISVQIGGHSAITHYQERNTDALRGDISLLSWMNIIEADKVPFVEGDLAVLEGRLDDAEAAFRAAMAGRDSCDVRVNLELVQETQGDVAVRYRDKDRARERYTTALELVQSAPSNCFEGNDDPSAERAEIRRTTEPRLLLKIEALDEPPLPENTPPPPENKPDESSENPDESNQNPDDSSENPDESSENPNDSNENPDDSNENPDDSNQNPDDSNQNPDDSNENPNDSSQKPNESGDGAPSPNSPIFEPGGGGPDQPGSPVLNDMDADRIASEGGGGVGHRLGEGGSPVGKLQRKLANADATGPSVP